MSASADIQAGMPSRPSPAEVKLESSSGAIKKRKMIDIACTACQRRKSKCDGVRPVCTMCSRKGSECKYSADLRRNSSLRDLNQQLLCQVWEYETLTNSLCYGDESQVAEAMQQLRIYKAEVESGRQQRADALVKKPVTAPQARESSRRLSNHNSNVSPDAWSSIAEQPDEYCNSVDGHAPEVGLSWDGHLASRSSTSQLTDLSQMQMTSPVDGLAMAFPGQSGGSSPFDTEINSVTNGNAIGAASFAMLNESVQPPFSPGATRGLATFDPSSGRDHFIPAAYMLPLNNSEESSPGFSGDESSDLSYSRTHTTVLRSFQLSRRELLREGFPLQHALGPSVVNASALVSEDKLASIDPLSALMTRIVNLFVIDDLTKLALMHLRHLTMQWLINPCEESFSRVPSIMRPTPAQYMVPHPMWVDFIPLPTLRDLFVLHVETRTILWPQQCSSLRVAWDWPVAAAVTVDAATGAVQPSQEFQASIGHADTWSMSAATIESFPCLKGCVKARAPAAGVETSRLLSGYQQGREAAR